MQWYYSVDTFGFYNDEVHGEEIPQGSVPICEDLYMALLEGQCAGQRIMPPDTELGLPYLADPPLPTAAELAVRVRAERDQKIIECNWIIERHRDQLDAGGSTTISGVVYREWLAYRQALRDVAEQEGFPTDIVWPEKPTE